MLPFTVVPRGGDVKVHHRMVRGERPRSSYARGWGYNRQSFSSSGRPLGAAPAMVAGVQVPPRHLPGQNP